MCLCDAQVSGCLRITHIIMPKQVGTADSCITESEEEIFDTLDKYDLITLGWIHVSFNYNLNLCCDSCELNKSF